MSFDGSLRLENSGPVPDGPDDVEALLREVPQMPWIAEFESLRFADQDLAEVADQPTHVQISRLANDGYVAKLVEALEHARSRADDEGLGPLAFLCVTMHHFLTKQKIPTNDHPLIAALYFRSLLDCEGPSTPASVANRMDSYDPKAADPAT